MMKIDRTGQKFGKLTVIADSGNAQLLCRCDCGVEELLPRGITKPSYKGRKMCSYCKGGVCEVCGKRIKYNSGQIPATCSDACAKARNNEREKLRYQAVKNTEAYKNTRSSYLSKLRERLNSDPVLYAAFRERAKSYLKKSRSKPEQIEKAKFIAKARWQRIKNDDALYETSVLYARKQYDNYSDDDYKRIFNRERSHTRARKSRSCLE
ncbi:hypothetical protein [Providencia sp. wls1922]|uniref:hypothetical protein n=1 Tax=Providencia sp. wls1922 TaxID=2675152 RepID=UPI001E36E441|nr:hypothetical protein [Providencia sp. wls1922]